MTTCTVFNNVTVNDVRKSPAEFADAIKETKLIAFKESNFTMEEGFEVFCMLGDKLGWYPNTLNPHEWRYVEDHSRSLDRHNEQGTNNKDHIIVSWHTEHSEYLHPQHGAAWNMLEFNCSPEVGTTGFIDMTKVFYYFTEDEIDLLRKAHILHVPLDDNDSRDVKDLYGHDMQERFNAGERVFKSADIDLQVGAYKAIQPHPITGEETLRLCPDGSRKMLIGYDGKEATPEQQQQFQDIARRFIISVFDGDLPEFWWKWTKGDMLVPDLFAMAHAVRGGFDYKQRKFVGFWAFSNSIGEVPTGDEGTSNKIGFWQGN